MTDGTKVHVLVVDDVPDTDLVTSSLLESLGCSVDDAEGGQAALERLSRNVYHLVFLDCHMPRMDGYEVVSAIRALPEANPTPRDVPVIGLTAMAFAGEREKCLDAGMNECLGKPVTRARLREILDEWTVGARQASPDLRDTVRTVSPSPRFRQLLEQLGGELMTRVMDLYLADLMPRVDALEAAVVAGDAKEARAVAHALKAASGNVGADALQRLAERLELTAEAGDLDSAAGMIGPLRAEAGRALGEFPRWLRP